MFLHSDLFCFADIDTPVAEDVTYKLPTPEKDWSHHMVRGSWFTKTNGLYNYGLPSPLLAYLRTTLQDDTLPTNDNVSNTMHYISLCHYFHHFHK